MSGLKYDTKMKRVKGPGDVPKGEHYAIIIYHTQSVHVDGDERSRTAPGHGYPAHTDTYDTFEHWVTTDRELWTENIAYLAEKAYKDDGVSSIYRPSPDKYVAFVVSGVAEVAAKINVTVGDPIKHKGSN